MNYIFRWKADRICVIPSRNASKDAVWEFAIDALRPAGMKSNMAAEKFVRTHGEVIEDNE